MIKKIKKKIFLLPIFSLSISSSILISYFFINQTKNEEIDSVQKQISEGQIRNQEFKIRNDFLTNRLLELNNIIKKALDNKDIVVKKENLVEMISSFNLFLREQIFFQKSILGNDEEVNFPILYNENAKGTIEDPILKSSNKNHQSSILTDITEFKRYKEIVIFREDINGLIKEQMLFVFNRFTELKKIIDNKIENLIKLNDQNFKNYILKILDALKFNKSKINDFNSEWNSLNSSLIENIKKLDKKDSLGKKIELIKENTNNKTKIFNSFLESVIDSEINSISKEVKESLVLYFKGQVNLQRKILIKISQSKLELLSNNENKEKLERYIIYLKEDKNFINVNRVNQIQTIDNFR